jgi:ABC-type nitrate/sulfonate/bicarbonate transport system substrate-binding protein
MAKIPLEDQVTAMISFIALAKAKGIEGNQDAVEAFTKTLQWMKENPDAVRLAYKISKEESVQAVKEAFPGARIESARKV